MATGQRIPVCRHLGWVQGDRHTHWILLKTWKSMASKTHFQRIIYFLLFTGFYKDFWTAAYRYLLYWIKYSRKKISVREIILDILISQIYRFFYTGLRNRRHLAINQFVTGILLLRNSTDFFRRYSFFSFSCTRVCTHCFWYE